jgi:CheY-like chemotaxis protein
MSNASSGISILIIDDEEDFAQTLAERLELRGMAVRCANGGEQGCALMREALPDLLLLDMRMPGLSGVDVLRRLRHENAVPGGARLPVFVISGHAAEQNIRDAEALGIQGYFPKPLQFGDLLAAIMNLMPDKA